jgi:hypothetical protein
MMIYCKKCGFGLLLPVSYLNVSDIGVRCAKCKALNIITTVRGELKSQRIEDESI